MSSLITSKLANGLHVVNYEIKGLKAGALAIWFRQGYRDERVGEENYYHLLEHVMLSGSRRYPSEFEIEQVVADTGAYLNASTWLEHLCLTTEFLIEDLEKIFDLTADLTLAPRLSQKTIDRETKIINEEMMKNATDIKRTMNYFSTISMYHGTPLAHLAYDHERMVKDATAEKISKLHQRLLNPSGMAIISIGDIPHERLLTLTQEYYGQLEKQTPLIRERAKPVPKTIEPDWPEGETKHIRLCWPAIGADKSETYVFPLINMHLTGHEDSILYRELRLKRGLVYNVKAFNNTASDAGYWYIDFTSSKPDEAITAVRKILTSLKLTTEDLTRAKLRLIHQERRLFRTNFQYAIKTLGISFHLLGRIPPAEETERKIEAIVLSDVEKVIAEYLDFDKTMIIKTK